jgi:hypothetical protein
MRHVDRFGGCAGRMDEQESAVARNVDRLESFG